MFIENPDAFKSWLTSILEPLCDADPAALAKYVYALVKKDKPLSELREGMLDQLDVFLQHETKPFVDMLFKSLESNEYLKNLEKLNLLPPTDANEPDKENDVDIHSSNGTLESRSGGATEERSPTAGGAPRHRVVVPRAPAKLAAPAPLAPAAPPLPRAPPHEHTLVKVSQPLTELLEEPVDQPIRRRERRVENLRDKDDRRRRRSRSWERRPRGRRHPDHNTEVRSRRPSRSPSPRGRYRNRSPPAVGPTDRPASRSRSRSPVAVRDHERERDRLRIPREIERDRMSRDREHMERVTRSRDRDRSRDRSMDRGSRSDSPNDRLEASDAFKRRCRDFDEKGYCMRGDLCQWDHGTDPVVLEDSTLGVLSMPPPVPEYNPLTPDIWSGSMPPYHPGPFGHPPPHPHQHPPRALIPVRIRDVPPPPGTMPLGVPSIPPPRHPMPRKNFDYNRLGPARQPPQGLGGNCSLEVKKVPRGLNDITHLNNHFSKFGKIVNIQVSFEGDPEGALITFSNHTEASVAYKSTEAVLNNRFIKVFWHNPENKSENVAPGGHANKHLNTHPHQQHPASLNKVLINRDNIKATDNKQQLEKAAKAEAVKEAVNGQEAPVKEPPKQVEKSKQVMEMHKRAQALLQTQLQQQVLLIEKLESGNVTGAQKTALMEAISSAQEGIEKLRKELVAYNKILKQMQANAKKPKTREEAQKEILDAELDMFTKQQEGQDVTELLKKVAELRRQMAIQFPVHPTMRRPLSRGGRFNPAMRFNRGAPAQKVFVNQTVDHRPRALLISGFEADELDSLVTHFSQYGEVTGKEVNLAVPELILQYKARLNAEQAMLRGKNYNDRTLSITWVTNNKTYGTTNTTPTPNGETTDTSIKESEPTPEVSEDVLLRFDEEEEDDAEEDRSWRR